MPRGAARIPRDFTCTRRAKLTREIVAQPLVSSPGPVTDKSRPIRVNVAKSVPSPSRSHSRKSVSPSRSRWQFPSNWKLLPWIESVSPSNKLNFLFSLFTLSFWLLSFSFFFFFDDSRRSICSSRPRVLVGDFDFLFSKRSTVVLIYPLRCNWPNLCQFKFKRLGNFRKIFAHSSEIES